MLAVTLVLASQALIPLWLAAAIVARDVVIVAGAVAFHFIVGRVEMAPSWLSKFNTVLEFGVLSALLADAARAIEVTALLPPLFVLVTATIVGSGVQYVWVWGRRAVRSKRERPPHRVEPAVPSAARWPRVCADGRLLPAVASRPRGGRIVRRRVLGSGC